MIKVLFITSQFNAMGGAEKNVLDLIKGVDPKIFSPRLAVLQSGPLAYELQEQGFPVWDIGLTKILSPQGMMKGIELMRYLRKEKISVVVCYHHDADIWGGFFAMCAGVPVVISSRRDMGYLLEKKHIWAYRFLNKFFSKTIAVSDAVKNVVVSKEWADPKDIITIYNGVDRKVYSPSIDARQKKIELGLDPDKKTVGMVANFRAPKRQENFVLAAARVLKKVPDTQFVMVGYKNTDYHLKVEQMIHDLNIAPSVHTVGARRDVPEILKALDVFVLCSTGEGFSNAILEAMASGVAAVVTRSGGNPEAVVDSKTGIVVEPDDVDELAEAIEALLSDDLLRQNYVKAATQLLEEKFTYETMVARIVELFTDLTANPRRRKSTLMGSVSKNVFYPLWDLYDRSLKLKELKRLEETQWDPPQDRMNRQWDQLVALTDYAFQHCPYYQKRHYPSVSSLAGWNQLPLLHKEEVRAHKDDLISREKFKKSLIQAKTGGSTGVSLEVYFDKECQERRNAAALLVDKWSGWNLGEPKGALWGNPPLPRNAKQRLRNHWLERLTFLDTVHMSADNMAMFIQEVRQKNIRTLYGHAHSLFILANYVRTQNWTDLKMEAIVSTSMSLLPSERAVIEAVFQCQVTNRYGCEEVGVIACECERHDGMHLNIDHLYIEFIKSDGSHAKPGEEGAIVVTDLINKGMPLIRYVTGDIGVLSNRRCPCGRTSPLMEKVIGRTADFLVKQDGSLVAGISLVERTLTAIPGIEQLQIVQEELSGLSLNMVADKNYTEATDLHLIDEIKSVFGDIDVRINKLSKLEQQKNGKYRFSICKVDNQFQRVPEEVGV